MHLWGQASVRWRSPGHRQRATGARRGRSLRGRRPGPVVLEAPPDGGKGPGHPRGAGVCHDPGPSHRSVL